MAGGTARSEQFSILGYNDVLVATAVLAALGALVIALVCKKIDVGGLLVARRTALGALAWLVQCWLRQVYNSKVRFSQWSSPKGTLPVFGDALGAAPALMRFIVRQAKLNAGRSFLFWPGGPSPIAVVSTPKAAKLVLGTSSFAKGADYTSKFGSVFGKGLVTSVGPDHSRARRVLGKYFVKLAIEEHSPIIRKIADRLADEVFEPRLEAADSEAVFDVQDFFHLATLHVFCKTMLNVDVDLLGTSESSVTLSDRLVASLARRSPGEAAAERQDFLPAGVVAKWISEEVCFGSNVIGRHMVFNLPVSKIFPGIRRTQTSLETLNTVLMPIIEARRGQMLSSSSCPDDCLTALLREQETNTDMPLPDLEVCQQLVTLLSAGHDTTAFFCCYASYLLAKHPDIQERLRIELADDDRFDFPSSLLKRVFQEVLRLYPIIPMVTRVAVRDAKLPTEDGSDLNVPKGTRLLVPFFAINRLPHIWGKDAAEFNPDRWIDSNEKTPSDGVQLTKNGFMPFGYGSRTCIGYSFALLESRAILSRLLARYELKEVPGFLPTIKAGISLTVENPKGIKISFKRRTS